MQRAMTGSSIWPRASLRALTCLNASGSARAASMAFWASSLRAKSSSLPETLAIHHASLERRSSGLNLASWSARNLRARSVTAGSATATPIDNAAAATVSANGSAMRKLVIAVLSDGSFGGAGAPPVGLCWHCNETCHPAHLSRTRRARRSPQRQRGVRRPPRWRCGLRRATRTTRKDLANLRQQRIDRLVQRRPFHVLEADDALVVEDEHRRPTADVPSRRDRPGRAVVPPPAAGDLLLGDHPPGLGAVVVAVDAQERERFA